MFLKFQKTLNSKNALNSSITGYKINFTIINNYKKTTKLMFLPNELYIYYMTAGMQKR